MLRHTLVQTVTVLLDAASLVAHLLLLLHLVQLRILTVEF